MKKIIFLIMAFVSLIAWSNAQSTNSVMWDTLSTSSSADTLYMYPGTGAHGALYAASKTFTGRGILTHYIVVDSLGGATALNIKLQYTNTTNPLKWYDKDSKTSVTAPVGGWPYKYLVSDTEFPFTRWRLMVYTTGSTTQHTQLTDTWGWKQIY